MGIPRLLEHLGTGERVALSKLAIQHLEKTNRPLRIAIDAAIWNFQTQSGQGGKNPALRTLFFRLLRLLALPIQPVFVYDGKNKPLTKRGRTVSGYGRHGANDLSIGLVKQFKFPWHVAPGEAEAECALLQKRGIVDMVMSQDVDAVMFGAGVTLRDWSKEGTRGNKAPTHVNVMELERLTESSGIDCDGMILVALLSGGDYDETGVTGFGAALACEVAKAGFGKDLIELVRRKDWDGLQEWRERLNFELETNESGYFRRKSKKIKVPDHFPNLEILSYYTEPAVSADQDLSQLEAKLTQSWQSGIDVQAFRDYTATMFDWCWKSGARRFVRCFAQPLFQSRLSRGTINLAAFSMESITERRQHFINDGIPELRLRATPADVVGLDIEAEEDNPEHAAGGDIEDDEDVLVNAGEDNATAGGVEGESTAPLNPSRRRQPWDPYVPEKWWIPETLLQLGMPEIVEDWHQKQRDILADPRKFATRKTVKTARTNKQIDAGMKTGALRGFLTNVSKRTELRAGHEPGITKNRSAMNGGILCLSKSSPEFGAQERIDTIEGNVVQSTLPPSQRSQGASSAADNARLPMSDLPQHLPGTADTQEASNKHNEEEETCASEQVLQGSTFATGLPIESSPVPATPPSVVEPLLTQEAFNGVTQRRQRRAKARTRKASNPPTTPNRPRRPIESFFVGSEEMPSPEGGRKSSFIKSPQNEIPSGILTGMLSRTGSTALARDSLPGTWKELDTNPAPSKRVPRVSYVDLTID